MPRGNPRPLAERFAEKYVINPDSGCWQWTASVNRKGYGQIGYQRRALSAHRLAYELYVGPIPDGLTIDHLCRNPSCVNPAHMEPVTAYENFLRGNKGSAGGRVNKQKTHCKRGHPYDDENTYVHGGHRFCKQCHRENRTPRFIECSVCGEEKPHGARGMCRTCYWRWNRDRKTIPNWPME